MNFDAHEPYGKDLVEAVSDSNFATDRNTRNPAAHRNKRNPTTDRNKRNPTIDRNKRNPTTERNKRNPATFNPTVLWSRLLRSSRGNCGRSFNPCQPVRIGASCEPSPVRAEP